MEIELEEAKILKKILRFMSFKIGKHEFIDVAEIKLKQEGLFIIEGDPSRICLFELKIPKASFYKYDFMEGEKQAYPFEVKFLNNIFLRIKDDESLSITFQEKNDFKKEIIMKTHDETFNGKFALFCKDWDLEVYPTSNLEKIEYPTSFEMTIQELKEIILRHQIYAENLDLTILDVLEFKSQNNDGHVKNTLNRTIQNKEKEKQFITININFLKPLLQLQTIIEKIKGYIRTGYPLKLKMDLINDGKLTWYLAPRVVENIPDEDDDF